MSRQCSSPTLDLKLNLSPPKQIPTWEISSEDHDGSCVSSEEEGGALVKCNSRCSDEINTSSMVLAGCPRCLMYMMLSEGNLKCPKCKSSVLLSFKGPRR